VGKPPVDDPDERHNRGGKISLSRRAPYAACEDVRISLIEAFVWEAASCSCGRANTWRGSPVWHVRLATGPVRRRRFGDQSGELLFGSSAHFAFAGRMDVRALRPAGDAPNRD
jgi:hypothetical protein